MPSMVQGSSRVKVVGRRGPRQARARTSPVTSAKPPRTRGRTLHHLSEGKFIISNSVVAAQLQHTKLPEMVYSRDSSTMRKTQCAAAADAPGNSRQESITTLRPRPTPSERAGCSQAIDCAIKEEPVKMGYIYVHSSTTARVRHRAAAFQPRVPRRNTVIYPRPQNYPHSLPAHPTSTPVQHPWEWQ
ncbi:hypothetical protein M011DRAFT_323608 [Sporormia fimetaria CBS 119925]|uniref:Uncharacterized protein n=1 Tax=Sporormia fimetaria CBS 119925 TaxID=1340428 RepID=A0A6A6VEL6_9PLEO|nr:hypothetical protein M011DRAFT_323608 [Sporormia fimetaria CBS 119925]